MAPNPDGNPLPLGPSNIASVKLAHAYADVRRSFSSTSALRNELLASYPGASHLGAPIVLIDGDRPAPAWGWLLPLLRTRSDWWPAIGVAIQHAADEGGDLARIALADLLESHQEAVVLLPWTEAIAERWPTSKSGLVATTLGWPEFTLASIVRGERKLWNEVSLADVAVEGLGPDGGWLSTAVRSAEELTALLARAAAAGTTGSDDGAWGWLLSTLLFHHELRAWMVPAAEELGSGSDLEVAALLDWFSREHDLWRHLSLVERWAATPQPWWNRPSAEVPEGWRHAIRQPDPAARTLGEVALGTLERARAQAETAPVLDLPRLW